MTFTRTPRRALLALLALALAATVAVVALHASGANAAGPFNYCYADGSSRPFNPGSGDPCVSGARSGMSSAYGRVDSGTTASICVVIQSSGGSSVTNVVCSASNGTGSRAGVGSPGCGTYRAQIRGKSSNDYDFQGHGWYSTC